jgi:hypothetical protein
MALLALGPFLHAHYGSSRLTGFHVDGMNALTTQAPVVLDIAAYFSSDTEEESPALGISASHTRQSLSDERTENDATIVWLLVVTLVCVSVAVRPPLGGRRPAPMRPPRAYRAGFPPLAHAPPAVHC